MKSGSHLGDSRRTKKHEKRTRRESISLYCVVPPPNAHASLLSHVDSKVGFFADSVNLQQNEESREGLAREEEATEKEKRSTRKSSPGHI